MMSPEPQTASGHSFQRSALAALAVLLAAMLTWVVLAVPERSAGAAALFRDSNNAQELVERSGVRNPVTSVLLNFRAYDTLLELAVLALAVLGARAAAVGASGRRKKPRELRNPLLAATVGIVVPLAIVTAGYLLWMGADYPGGAFQAGAVLGGAGIMLVLAGYLHGVDRFRRGLDSAAVAGVITFLIVGTGVMTIGGRFLEYRADTAKALIFTIEVATIASVAAIFVSLFQAVFEGVAGTARVSERRGEDAP